MSAAAAIQAFQAGIRHGNIATSWLATSLSSAIPTIGSILIYHDEQVRPIKAFALLLIPIAIVLLWKEGFKIGIGTPLQEQSTNGLLGALVRTEVHGT